MIFMFHAGACLIIIVLYRRHIRATTMKPIIVVVNILSSRGTFEVKEINKPKKLNPTVTKTLIKSFSGDFLILI
ncbi:unknown [Methanothermobacter thermautotrophicus str. Delta H]|uniref:Uncharacterized protein n=1 Tax=Methanothermobacter thermautotrophicus (strain ATCC 29096 / DSM 1053 / JCM 10044 / NBRC 100330 / Delta H) TaxID=187420 RepID=O27687_METTH|nr:unknown [Methanothermobacter thermautotrophicus str. Delta H]